MIICQGSSVPEEMKLYGGIVGLKVRPFVSGVIQCYKCYKYGHFKFHCKGEALCKVCGEDFHDRCDRDPKCTY